MPSQTYILLQIDEIQSHKYVLQHKNKFNSLPAHRP
jgi:hypothetical protein